MSNAFQTEPLILCPDCKSEMHLFGLEAETEERDLFTFECPNCGRLEARSALVVPDSP
jgi:hypothetical protein